MTLSQMKKMSAAVENLKSNQRQLDMDGCEVGVSRQALDEAISEYSELMEALKPFAEPHKMGDNYVQFAPRLIEAARTAIAKAQQEGL